MGANAKLKEFSVEGEMLHIAVSIEKDAYDKKVHSPKASFVFETDRDMRQVPLPVQTYELTESGCRIFGSYTYNLKDIFWNIVWEDCTIYVNLEYGNEYIQRLPLQQDCMISYNNDFKVQILGDQIRLSLARTINCQRKKNPNLLQVILATLCHLITGFLGLLLLPWFVIDSLVILCLHTEEENDKIEGSFLKRFILYVGWRFFGFCRNTKGVTGAKEAIFKSSFYFFNAIYRRKKKLLFLSNRREDLTGNFEFVYQKVKDQEPCLFWLETGTTRELSIAKLVCLGRYLAEAKVILVDDYIPFLSLIVINKETKIVQLWHACGAFKTFGFSRLSKQGGPEESSTTHRYYDYVIVSSVSIVPHYAEAFGVSYDKVLPLGVPRTDIFFDPEYADCVRNKFYGEYPDLKGKRIILFAPTFRGNGKNSAYYDREQFDPNQVIGALSEDVVLIIKHHPFIEMTYQIKEENKNRIYDFSSESEINDLLFITDVLITDYSSVIFEASLLNIPMLFYAYDLQEYIASRDFYSEYETFVPGKIVETQEELIKALADVKPDQERMDAFKKENFEFLDGKSSQRVAEKVMSLME